MATTKINWKEVYSDLATHVAEALRTARVKPEQLILKEDGELMAIPGITEQDVESIRAIYNTDSVVVATPEELKEAEVAEEVAEEKKVAKKIARKRSNKYKTMTKLVKKDELYSVKDAVELLGKLTKGSKLKTVELHLNTRETGLRGELKLPHATGKDVKIAIFSDEVVAKINDNNIDFDILLCTPADMAKLSRFAKVLGPKGLMPNPKSGTVTENPEKRAKELASGGTLPYKSEAKFPIIHLNLGPITQKSEDLVDNIIESLKGIGISKIKTAYLSCTHTPSVKLSLGSI